MTPPANHARVRVHAWNSLNEPRAAQDGIRALEPQLCRFPRVLRLSAGGPRVPAGLAMPPAMLR